MMCNPTWLKADLAAITCVSTSLQSFRYSILV